jgi:Ca-activated chloride channel family protein
VSFDAPIFLLCLLLVPLAILALRASRRRATRYAVRFPAAATLKLAAGTVPAWRRHLPAAVALAAMAALALALAKPHRTIEVPSERASIMLVTDHSRSMLATDVEPNRLTAAKKAAQAFLAQVPERLPVGVVAYSNAPDAVQTPSRDHDDARSIIEDQEADGATATGDALLVARDALVKARTPGRRTPSAIVLVSDGQTTVGLDPVEVARTARRFKIPIFTISLGTDAATVPSPELGAPRLPAVPDPVTLRRIAEVSGGQAFSADDDDELSSIYKELGSQLGTRKERREITSAFAVAGLLLLLGAGAASLRTRSRLP